MQISIADYRRYREESAKKIVYREKVEQRGILHVNKENRKKEDNQKPDAACRAINKKKTRN